MVVPFGLHWDLSLVLNVPLLFLLVLHAEIWSARSRVGQWSCSLCRGKQSGFRISYSGWIQMSERRLRNWFLSCFCFLSPFSWSCKKPSERHSVAFFSFVVLCCVCCKTLLDIRASEWRKPNPTHASLPKKGLCTCNKERGQRGTGVFWFQDVGPPDHYSEFADLHRKTPATTIATAMTVMEAAPPATVFHFHSSSSSRSGGSDKEMLSIVNPVSCGNTHKKHWGWGWEWNKEFVWSVSNPFL